MHLDNENLLSEDQAITATAYSDNVIDLEGANYSSPQEFVSKFGDAKLMALVTEEFTNLTSLDISIETSDTEEFTSALELFKVGVNRANLALGKQVAVGGALLFTQRYIRAKYTVNGSAPDAGKLVVGWVMNPQTNGMRH